MSIVDYSSITDTNQLINIDYYRLTSTFTDFSFHQLNMPATLNFVNTSAGLVQNMTGACLTFSLSAPRVGNLDLKFPFLTKVFTPSRGHPHAFSTTVTGEQIL